MKEKDYIEIRPEAPGVQAKDLMPALPLLGLRTRECAGAARLKARSGGVKYPGQVAPTTGPLILVPPRPKEEVFTVFLNLNCWKGYCYHKILIMVHPDMTICQVYK